MRPEAYAALYGRWEPAHVPPSRAETAVALAARVLWGLTVASLAWLTFVVGMSALFIAADGGEVGGFLRPYVLVVAGGAAVPAALAFVPRVRRLDPAVRSLLLGALAFPLPAGTALCTLILLG